MEKKMVSWGYIGIMIKEMETTTIGYVKEIYRVRG